MKTNIINKEFFLMIDNIEIHIKLQIPDNTPLPVCIIAHGITGDMEETTLLNISNACVEMGCAALRVDLYGHGKSGGDFYSHNIEKWKNELVYIVDYVRGLEVTSEIYLFGHSQGGVAAMLAAAERKNTVDRLILLSPAEIIVKKAREGVFFKDKAPEHFFPEELIAYEKLLSGEYLRTAAKIDIDVAINAYSREVLLIHGTDDCTVPVEGSREIAEKYRNCTYIEIPDEDHCYNYHQDKVIEVINRYVFYNNHI